MMPSEFDLMVKIKFSLWPKHCFEILFNVTCTDSFAVIKKEGIFRKTVAQIEEKPESK